MANMFGSMTPETQGDSCRSTILTQLMIGACDICQATRPNLRAPVVQALIALFRPPAVILKQTGIAPIADGP